jgi:hypothetical protein
VRFGGAGTEFEAVVVAEVDWGAAVTARAKRAVEKMVEIVNCILTVLLMELG